jgi:hypothetical protein
MRICAECRQPLDDPRDHDCPADLEPEATPDDDGDA